MRLFLLYLSFSAILLQSCSESKKESAAATNSEDYYTEDDFKTINKIDAHVHVNTNEPGYVQQASEDNFRLITINLDDVNEPPPMEEQQKFALHQVKAFPNRIAYATTFSIRNFNDSNWQARTISYLKKSFENGAIAVKIYKVIGLSLRDKTGKLVMIDDPRFDTVINFIIQNKIPVLGHLGEPKNCWLPAEQMTINGDRTYFTNFPMYHMYMHPEFPSYETQIAARDHMLERHPDLQFIGAHLGSLEWNVDELAKRLDKFPNMAVDMAARIVHLQYQAAGNWEKVHDFMIRYQDRLLYATDGGIEANADINKNDMHSRYINDWKFFTSGDTMTSKEFKQSFKGLKLPKQVIDKIYHTNAEKWFPGTRTFRSKISAS